MAAHEALGQQFFHGTDADLNVGDEISPGDVAGAHKFSSSAAGHGEFVWSTPHASKAAFFGKKVYQVEPTGLHNLYDYGPGGSLGVDKDAHVSLAPMRVVRKGQRNATEGQSARQTLGGDNPVDVKWDDEQ